MCTHSRAEGVRERDPSTETLLGPSLASRAEVPENCLSSMLRLSLSTRSQITDHQITVHLIPQHQGKGGTQYLQGG